MNELDRRLQETFVFQEFDVRANRAGRLSRRQEALLQAAGRKVRLVFLAFAVVIVASVVLAGAPATQARGQWLGGAPPEPDTLIALGMAAAVAAAVIGIGVVLLLRYRARLGTRQFSVARGEARVAHNAPGNWQIRIGVTRLRLPSEKHLRAFEPGVEYRVYYLPGAMPLLLSAETAASDRPDSVRPLTAADEVQLARKEAPAQTGAYAWWVVAALGALALGIPVAGVLSGALPAWQRYVVMSGLSALAAVYAPLAIRFVSPRRR